MGFPLAMRRVLRWFVLHIFICRGAFLVPKQVPSAVLAWVSMATQIFNCQRTVGRVSEHLAAREAGRVFDLSIEGVKWFEGDDLTLKGR
jgi:hypothetical protein